MDEFLAIALGYPTVVVTVPLALLTVYWLTVILGFADVDVLGGKAEGVLDAAAGKAEGVLEAAAAKAEGVLEAAAGKTEGMLDAAAAKAEAAASVDHGHASAGAVSGLLSALRLRRAPATVVLSVLLLVAWVLTFFAVRLVVPALPLPVGLAGTLVLLGALLVSWPLTALVTYPLGAVSQTLPAVRHAELVGRTVVVTTSRVDGRFGEAELRGSGPPLVLQVRCAAPNALAKGREALVVSWDAEREAFDVEPLDAIVGRSRGAANDG